MRLHRSLLLSLVLFGFVAVAAAQDQGSADGAQDAAESRSTSFQAVEGAQGEQIPGGPLVVGAYGFVLVLIIAYVARLARMQAQTTAEVERLTRAIEQAKRG